jgi:hypothetical protein
MYTTKGGSQFVEEIYTHYEAQMQLIFSKKKKFCGCGHINNKVVSLQQKPT